MSDQERFTSPPEGTLKDPVCTDCCAYTGLACRCSVCGKVVVCGQHDDFRAKAPGGSLFCAKCYAPSKRKRKKSC